MNKVERIKADIDRLQETTMDENRNFLSSYHEGIFDGLSMIDNFIDSLEEEPVSNDLEEAAHSYVDTTIEWSDSDGNPCCYPAFIAGAQWQKDTFIEKTCEFFGEHLWKYINVKNANCDTFINIDGDKLKEDFKKYIKGE